MKKIKRYKRIYTKRRSSGFFKAVGFIALGCALVFVGFSLAGPVSDFLSGNIKPPDRPSSSDSSVSSSPSSIPTSSKPNEAEQASIKGAYLPVSILKDQAKLDAFIAFAKANSINTAYIDIKTADGLVHYNTSLQNVISAKAVADADYDIKAQVEKLKANGIRAVAKMHIFKDPLASKAFSKSAVKYKPNPEFNWVDNSPDKGGKAWFNPYDDFAKQYNIDIANELISLGFNGIMADSVMFPTGYALEQTYYGERALTVTKEAALAEFVTTLTKSLEEKKATFSLASTASSILSPEPLVYGTGSTNYNATIISPFVVPSLFGNEFKAGDLSISAPAKDPYTTVKSIMEKIKAINSTITYIPFIQSYTNTALASDVNKEYTKTDVEQQIKALNELSIKNYILYDPTGLYGIK